MIHVPQSSIPYNSSIFTFIYDKKDILKAFGAKSERHTKKHQGTYKEHNIKIQRTYPPSTVKNTIESHDSLFGSRMKPPNIILAFEIP